jgi:5-methylcytosine-specific restriction endonuclease McrA
MIPSDACGTMLVSQSDRRETLTSPPAMTERYFRMPSLPDAPLDGQSPTTKICTVCRAELPATSEFFHSAPYGRGGLAASCKECRNKFQRDKRARDPEQRIREATYRAANRDATCEYLRKYYEEKRERFVEYRLAHRDEIHEYMETWREEHRDEVLEYSKNYYYAHKDDEEYQRKASEYRKEYYREHKDYYLAIARNRKARVKNAVGTHTASDIELQHARQHGKCFWCGKRVGRDFHVDHVVPIFLGGSNGPENLVISCPACNMSKGAKHPMDWDGRMF